MQFLHVHLYFELQGYLKVDWSQVIVQVIPQHRSLALLLIFPITEGSEYLEIPILNSFQVVIREIHNEQQLMEQGGEWGEQFKNAKRLLAAEADKLENSIDPEWLEVDIAKPIKVSKKVFFLIYPPV